MRLRSSVQLSESDIQMFLEQVRVTLVLFLFLSSCIAQILNLNNSCMYFFSIYISLMYMFLFLFGI